jgi:hypothetical protein
MDGLGAKLRWWESGWPAWPVYAPLFASVWHDRIALIGGDLPKSAPAPDLQTTTDRLGPDGKMMVGAWSDAMKKAQCGLADDATAQKAGLAEAARDLAFADALTKGDDKKIFYAGRSHVQLDRSVPHILAAKNVGPLVSVALQEVSTPDGSVNRDTILKEAKGRFDYVWFTGVAAERDACTRLREKGLIK